VVVATLPEKVAQAPQAAPLAGARPIRHQAIRDTASGVVADVPVYDRAALPPGAHLAGPALIAEDETSTLVGAGWNARIDGLGYIVMEQANA
jgi:N-methylhydantoinase A